MNKKVSFHELAEFELNDAVVFFESKTAGLGTRFLTAVEKAVAQIERHPQASPIIRHDVRRKLVWNFPYSIMSRSNSTTSASSRLRIKSAGRFFGGDGGKHKPAPVHVIALKIAVPPTWFNTTGSRFALGVFHALGGVPPNGTGD